MLTNIKRFIKKIRNFFIRHKKISNPKLFMNILAKNEVDIIEHQILFHKAMGVDGFIVTDNNSSDGTKEIFEKYKEKGWIKEIINETSCNYEQVKWVDRMIKLARDKYNADWVINADADEFWCCEHGDLKTELAESFSNVIYAKIFNVYPYDEDEFYKNDNLIANYKNIKPEIKEMLSPYSMYTRQIPKVIHRTKGYITIKPGYHSVKMKLSNKIFSENIHIYHYSLRSLEHFKRKMINGGASLKGTKSLAINEGQHWAYFYDIFINQGYDYSDEYERVVGSKYFDEFKNSRVFKKGTKVKDFFSKEDLNG